MHHDPENDADNHSVAAGAGLTHTSTPGALPRWTNTFVMVAFVVVTLGSAYTLVNLNAAFAEGKANGTSDGIGKIAAPGSGGETTVTVAPGSPEAEGRALMGAKNCGGCHVVPGISTAHGAIGPSLAGVAGRTKIAGGVVPNSSPDDLKKWILDPPTLKPGTQMPKLGLTEDEATKIVSYLELLK